MDRITKSLLEEFSRESGLSHLPDEDQFEHLAAYLTAGRHVGESFDTGEPARIFRRHKLLRGCAHGKSIQVSSRSAGASGPARF
jgi:hypothetical protein